LRSEQERAKWRKKGGAGEGLDLEHCQRDWEKQEKTSREWAFALFAKTKSNLGGSRTRERSALKKRGRGKICVLRTKSASYDLKRGKASKDRVLLFRSGGSQR